MTLCKKGGRCQKNSNFGCMIKSDILVGEGGGAKPMSFFSRCFTTHHLLIFQLILLHFEFNLNISKYIKLCVRSVPVIPKDCVSPQDYVSPAFSMFVPKFA